jgi:hypothetical protein
MILAVIPIFTWSYLKGPDEVCFRSPLFSERIPIGLGSDDLVVKMTFPKCDGMALPAGSNLAEGTYSGNLAGQEIWILVYGPDQKYYPQSSSDPCQAMPAQVSDGRWKVNLFLGVQPPEQFDIVVTITDTDSTASQEFKEWLKTGCESGKFPGLELLPEDLTEMDAITVKTK